MVIKYVFTVHIEIKAVAYLIWHIVHELLDQNTEGPGSKILNL